MIQQWLDYLAHERRLSAATVATYQRSVRGYTSHISAAGLAPAEITAANLRTYMAERAKAGVGPRTRGKDLAAIKAYHAVANARGSRRDSSLPRPVSVEDVQAMIEAAGQTNRAMWENLRDRALLTLLWGCGLRISEALALRAVPLGDMLLVTGKGDVQRMVPVLPAVREAVAAYLRALPRIPFDDSPLFVTASGGGYLPRHAQLMVERLRGRLGLADTVTPHALRHSFATHLLAGGADMRVIQELMGHSSVSTTMIYADVDPTQLMAAYNNAQRRAA